MLTVDAVRVRIAPAETFLADRKQAAQLRQRYLAEHEQGTVVVDLESIDFMTISAAQALIADWLVAARTRAPLVAIIATPKADVIEAVDAALRRTRQGAYWVRSAAHPDSPQVIGEVTETNERALAFFHDRPQATASEYADAEPELKPNAATQRLVDLTARGLLLRQDQAGRVGDLFVYPFKNGRTNGRPSPSSPRSRLAAAR